jgi:uncharacterized protein YndB with AHSA1/START domain
MHERTIALTRVYDAPRQRVFDCWTHAEHLQHWFAPRGYTIHSCQADARPGGVLKFCMRAPDGDEYWVRGEYREVAAPERLLITCVADDEQGIERLHETIRVTFTESQGRTTVAINATASGASDKAAWMMQGMEQGWAETVARLGDILRR